MDRVAVGKILTQWSAEYLEGIDGTQQSPMAYLTTTRMRHAARMLREGKCALKEIAAMVGFHSVVGFHNAFKRTYHISPGAFRAQIDAQTTPMTVGIALV